MDNIIIIGAGGHAKVIADIVIKNNLNLLGFLDDNEDIANKIGGFKYLGKISKCLEYDACFCIGIGDNQTRRLISEKYNLKYISLIHPTTQIGLNVKIGCGTVAMANTVINSGSNIGNHSILNTGSIIEHDNIINDFVHISPNVSLGGSVVVGKNSHIGIGAVVKNNVYICENCIIGAGGVVVKNIEESGVYVGVPVKRIVK